MTSTDPQHAWRVRGLSRGACLLLAALALAWSLPAEAQVGVSALPTLYQVPWLEAPERRVRLALSGGYGAFGDILEDDDSHHRVLASAGAAYQAKAGFGVEARLDTRYDKHVLKSGSDSGAVLDPRLAVRYARALNDSWSLGGQVGVWLPGKNFPTPAPAAITTDLLLLAGAHLTDTLDLALSAGYRIDRSAEAVDHPEQLSSADFAAIGLSSFDAALAGIGLRADLGAGAVLMELGGDILVGSGAPSFTRSPLHATAGFDYALGAAGTRLRVLLSAALSSRPKIDPMKDPAMVPLLPRVWLLLGITQDVFTEKPVEVAEVVEEPVAPLPVPEPVVEPVVEPEQPRGVIRVLVRDTDWGEPLEATITVLTSSKEEPAATGRTTKLSEGVVELPVAPGRYEVLIESKGYAPQKRTLSVDEGGVTVLNVDLRPKEKP
jgi:hypothetical protein